MEPSNQNPQQNREVTGEPQKVADSVRPRHDRKTEKKVQKLFSVFKSGTARIKERVDQEQTFSQLDYKLAQRFDSMGNTSLSRRIANLSEKKKGFSIASTLAFLHNRTPLQWVGMSAGVMMLSLVFCGLISFGLIYFRGTDVPILRNMTEQTPPILSLTKASETEYGVATAGNTFTIASPDDVTFRSLGLQNKVSVYPPFDFDLEVSEDMASLVVIPSNELKPDTEYKVTIRKGTMFSDGTSLAQDFSWTFRTEPTFIVTGLTPRDGTDTAPVDTAIEVEFTYKDLDVEVFRQYFEISPAVDGRFELHGKKIVFLPAQNLVPLSQYKVTVKEGFPNSRGDVLPETTTSLFRVSSSDSSEVYVPHPMMVWTENSPIISVTQEPWIGMYNFQLSGSVLFTLYSAQKEALIDVMEEYRWDIYEKPDPGHIAKVREFTLSAGDAEFFNIDLNDYGIYFLEAYNESYGRSIYKFIIYSPLGIVYSDAKDSTRVWLSDMNEKVPVGGGTVDYYDFDVASIPVHSATTDSNGYTTMNQSGGDFVIVEYLDNYAVGGSFLRNDYWWYAGGSWDRMEVEDLEYRAYVYTDRPLYRPGDTVHFKAIIRDEDDMSYSLPENKKVTIRFGESSYWWYGLSKLPYFEEEFEISKDFGTAEGEFVIPANVDTGYQTLGAYIDGVSVGSTSFTVAEYEKPRYLFTLSLDKTLAYSGDTLTVEVNGTDYSGDPAAGQKVGLSIDKSKVTSGSWIDDPEEFYAYSSSGGTSVANETLTLDANGRAVYEVDLDVAGYDTQLGSYRVSIWSKENYVNHDTESVLVANSSLGLFLKSENSSVKEGDGNRLTFWTAHLWDMEDESGVRVNYDITRSWTEWVESGDYYDPVTKTRKPLYKATTSYSDVLVDQEVTTDAQGLATVNLSSLERGNYTVVATYYDGDTSYIRRFEYVFYVYEPPENGEPMYSDWSSSWQKFKIYTDKSEYVPGETAQVAIKTTLKGKGIYMVKRGDVYEWRVADFSSGFVEIQQEITDEMAPNVSVCAWGIDEYTSPASPVTGLTEEYLTNVFRGECIQIEVNKDRGKLLVTLTPDKASYTPGEEVEIEVSVTDGAGRGASAEVSVGVVDKALLDLMKSSYGYSVDVYGGFYESVRQQSYQVSAPFSYNYGAGGGAGGGESPVRSNFADSAYWDGRVRTNSSGKASVSFTLPDNLTTWTARAVAVTEDTWVGQGTVDFIAHKDVRLDTLVPGYLRSGDSWTMDLEAANYSGSTLTANVTVECDGCVDTSYSSNIRLGAGTRQIVAFTLEPESGTDDIRVTGSLVAGGTTYDQVEWTVPILPLGFEHNDTAAVLMEEDDEDASIQMTIPSGVPVPGTELHLTFSRSYLNEWALVPVDPTVTSSVDLASSIIHNSFFVEYYDEVEPAERKEIFEQKVSSSLELLEKNQSVTGGYGWFDYDAINYEISSYVGIALGRAASAGFDLEDERVENLKSYLWTGLNSEATNIDEKIYAIYALSVLGDETVLPTALYLKSQPELFADSALDVAHLMLALEELGSVGDAGELAAYLEQMAMVTERGASWQDPDAPFRVLESQEYITAVSYLALSPFDVLEITGKARTWLVENPVSVYGNSSDAVMIFYALASTSIENLEGRQGAVKVSVLVNGKPVRTFDVGGGSESAGTIDLPIDSVNLVEGLNQIDISRSGEGQLYVVANMTYASSDIEIVNGWTVVRTIKDFSTGQPVASVENGQVVSIETKVTVDRDGYDLVMTDILPSGFEPVRYELGSYDYSFYSKWWKWGCSNYVNRYGRTASDRVTFTEYQIEDGATYTFEYPAVATFSGVFSGGGAQAYLLGFGDIGGYVISPEMTVED